MVSLLVPSLSRDRTMEKLEPKKEEPKIESLFQLLSFLEEEFGENATKQFFKPIVEQRARANIVVGDHAKAKEERIKRLKNTEVTPITVARLNQAIDIYRSRLEVALRNPERLEKNIQEEKEEMFNAMKGKEIIMDGEGNIEVKTQKK